MIPRGPKVVMILVWIGGPSTPARTGVALLCRELSGRHGDDPNKKAGDYLHPAVYLKENVRLESALRQLQRAGERLAIVLDARHHEIGILTLEDILGFVFGDVNW